MIFRQKVLIALIKDVVDKAEYMPGGKYIIDELSYKRMRSKVYNNGMRINKNKKGKEND